ncbi:MAG TPA: sulfurtransferase TusA family protein [Gemmataceae bacterium]|nr:sulfurtransferase TusA family protein [Gemmataceae bacterium]
MADTDPIIVDVRGLSCPQPVIATHQALGARPGGHVQVLVDTGAQRDNVSRLARREGWAVAVEPADDGFRVLLSK